MKKIIFIFFCLGFFSLVHPVKADAYPVDAITFFNYNSGTTNNLYQFQLATSTKTILSINISKGDNDITKRSSVYCGLIPIFNAKTTIGDTVYITTNCAEAIYADLYQKDALTIVYVPRVYASSTDVSVHNVLVQNFASSTVSTNTISVVSTPTDIDPVIYGIGIILFLLGTILIIFIIK